MDKKKGDIIDKNSLFFRLLKLGLEYSLVIISKSSEDLNSLSLLNVLQSYVNGNSVLLQWWINFLIEHKTTLLRIIFTNQNSEPRNASIEINFCFTKGILR